MDFSEDGISIILVKIILIMDNKCSQADIAHNSVNCSHNDQQSTYWNKLEHSNKQMADLQASCTVRAQRVSGTCPIAAM